MKFNLADLSRRLENLVRFGTIAEVKHGRVPQVRLQIGDIKTGFLPMATARAGKTKTWNPPTVGEQCVLLSPSGEFAGGVVLPGIASNHNPAPDTNPDNTRTEYPDGATADYNHAEHHYIITLPTEGKFSFVVGNTSLELRNDGVTLRTPKFEGVKS
ncbi:phage baseplate assembly protein V [Undibacterium sp. TC9W]|uniref:phage baseplate assembly protein V n=1 Tax=Undibacterium sp. TC9W TaxID=3413053 RepID=UPI003BF1E75E